MGSTGIVNFSIFISTIRFHKGLQRKDVNFIGYTFNREVESQRSYLLQALLDLENARP